MQNFIMYPTMYENSSYTQQQQQQQQQQQNVSTLKQLDLSFSQYDPSTLSPFSTSPDDSTHFSCEDLNLALSQTHIHPTKEKEEEPILGNAILLEMLDLFPDLPSFIDSDDFFTFANLWFEYRKMSVLARHPINRSRVQHWLESAALQIHFVMITIVKTHIDNHDPESQPRKMFSAFRKLKDHIEITHQVFRIIENGRVFFNHTPSQAIEPLIESAMNIKRDVNYFMNHPLPVIPVIEKNDDIILKNTEQVTMNELSSRVMDTYNLMPYNQHFVNNTSSNLGTNNNNNGLSFQHQQQQDTNEPNHHQPIFSHIQLSWVHHAAAFASSLPVTPSIENTNKHFNQYLSLPTTPTCTQQEATLVDNTCAPCNSVHDLSLSPYQQSNNSPLNTLSHDGESDYEMNPMDIDVHHQQQQKESEESEQDEEEDDDEYVVSDSLEDEDWKETKKTNKTTTRKRRTATMTIRSNNRKDMVTTTKELRKATQPIRRTATSYDAQTTHYLKSMFFDIYSSRDKLTKDQRRQVQKETGLKPRNITYWFSNHKRRFQNSLLVFKQTVAESNGAVKTYDDFLQWRKLRGLSEEVLEHEVLDITSSNSNSAFIKTE